MIPSSVLSSVRQLPEVESALTSSEPLSSSASADSIRRAVEVFASFGGPEHRAVLCLLAESLEGAGRYGEAADALSEVIRSSPSNDAARYGDGGDGSGTEVAVAIRLARSKALFHAGEFGEAYGLSKEASDIAVEDDNAVRVALGQGCALNAMSLCRLGLLPVYGEADRDDDEGDEHRPINPSTMMEAVDIREVLSMAASVLRNAFHSSSGHEPAPELAMAGAAAYGNLGVADLVHSTIRAEATGTPPESIRTDGALNAWRDGLSLLDELGSTLTSATPHGALTARQSAISDSVRAGLLSNMAHALLFGRGRRAALAERDLTAASEYAKGSLGTCDGLLTGAPTESSSGGAAAAAASQTSVKAQMARALSLTASCYARAGSAVTAEGLFQSAIESTEGSGGGGGGAIARCPVTALADRDARQWYSDLCSNWERRERDAEQLLDAANEIDTALPGGWRGRAGMFAGLWFFGLNDFR